MSDFRFINDKSQDDTGRTATYLQKSLPIVVGEDLTVTINPTSYVNTFVFEGEQNTNAITINIAAQHNVKSNKGDYLELIFSPIDTLEVNLGFIEVLVPLTAGQRFVAYFQYDGTNWLYTNPQSSGGGGGAVNTVNNIAPVSGNVDLGTIVNSVNSQSGDITIAAPPQVFIGLLGGGAPNGNVQVLKNTIPGCTMTVSKLAVGRYRLTSNIRLYFDTVGANIAIKCANVISSSQALPNINLVQMEIGGDNYSFDFLVFNSGTLNDNWTTIRFTIEVY